MRFAYFEIVAPRELRRVDKNYNNGKLNSEAFLVVKSRLSSARSCCAVMLLRLRNNTQQLTQENIIIMKLRSIG